MKKSKLKKALIITLLVLIVLAIIGLVVCYFVIPTQLKEFGNQAWIWLNRPLPIVGISTLMVLLFAWRVFASSSLGRKQIRELNAKYKHMQEEHELLIQERVEFEQHMKELFEKELGEKEQEIGSLKDIISKICKLTPNKKIKELGDEVYGEEVNGSTETKDL